jgi:hypothetical protein
MGVDRVCRTCIGFVRYFKNPYLVYKKDGSPHNPDINYGVCKYKRDITEKLVEVYSGSTCDQWEERK